MALNAPTSQTPLSASPSPSSSRMITHTSIRRPLGELPLAEFVFAARNEDNIAAGRASSPSGPAPILKPLMSKKRAAETSDASSASKHTTSPSAARHTTAHRVANEASSRPSTPPLHGTKPRNIRPHHPHVYTSPSTISQVGTGSTVTKRIASPSVETAAAQSLKHLVSDRRPSTPSQPNRHARTLSQASSSTNSSDVLAQGVVPSSLPRKRDRVTLMEVAQARQSVDEPVTASPSPHKKAAERRRSVAGNHRALSTENSNKQLARDGTGAFNDDNVVDAEAAMLPADGSGAVDADSFEVRPLKISTPASAKRKLSPRNSDIFGSRSLADDGGLVIWEDDAEPLAPVSMQSISQNLQKSKEAFTSDPDKENLAFHSPATRAGHSHRKSQSRGRPASPKTRPLEAKHEAELSDAASSSSFFKSTSPSSESSTSPLASEPTKISSRKRKGTGGRLSLLASADANTSLEADRSAEDDEIFP